MSNDVDVVDEEEVSTEAPEGADSSVLAMSDEEFLKSGASTLAPKEPAVAPVEASEEPVKEPSEGETPEGGDQPTEASKPEAVVQENKEENKEPTEAVEKVIDYKAEYERLVAPFKANGKDIQVASVDDAIALMQMGANYNKKMAALKPNLKILKMLENNQLLDEQKLSFLIDLDKKVPNAINKLVKDSGIDPMEIDADKAGDYKQNTYGVDDKEIELDTVLEEIKDSSTYNRTLDVVGNKWDIASKQVVAKAPQLLKVINDHVERGIYDVISAEVERERLFGRLQGMSDLDAYKHVGDAIQARGGFNHLVQAPKGGNQGTIAPSAPKLVQPKPKAEDPAIKSKKLAAASTKTAAPTTVPADFNPLSMSDEEFAKMAALRFR